MSVSELHPFDSFRSAFGDYLSRLGKVDARALYELLRLRSVDAGERVIEEGERAASLLFILSGSLQVSVAGPSGPRVVARVGEGTAVGEVSLLDPGPATASVEALGRCEVLVLDADDVAALWTSKPMAAAALTRGLCKLLAERIRGTHEALDAVADETEGLDAAWFSQTVGTLWGVEATT